MTRRTSPRHTVVFECNECEAQLDTEERDFDAARATMRAEGWRAVKGDDGWTHVCEDCFDG